METIVILNPAIDGAAEAEEVRPIRKVRTWGERYEPGGGGINASRAIEELGGSPLEDWRRERHWDRSFSS